MVSELNRLSYHPMTPHPLDILIFTIPYPIKRIHFGA